MVDGEVVCWDWAAGRLDFARRLTAAREVGRALAPTGRARPRRLATFSGSGDPVLVQPVVAEFLVDVAIERGRLRHPARFSQLRLELDPGAVTPAEAKLIAGRPP